MKNSMRAILMFVIALSFSFVPALLGYLFDDQLQVSKQFNSYFVYSTLLICAPLLIPVYFIRHWISLVVWTVGIFFISTQYFLLNLHWHLYKQPINSSTMFIILESNFAESTEFLSAYLDTFLLVQISAYFVYLIAASIAMHYLLRIVPRLNKHIRLLVTITTVVILVTYNYFSDISNNTVFHLAQEGYQEYLEESKKYENFKFHESLGFQKPYERQATDKPETVIIIIGESTTKSHMGLYGYYRNTNPELSKLAEELTIYKDVISPHTNTINSLTEILTPGDAIDAEKKFEGSLVQFFNAGGFKTYWLSNQRPIGVHENLVTKMAKAADQKIFINTLQNNLRTPFDSSLVPLVKEAIDEKISEPKAIFVHLMGSHAKYNYRFPSHYKIFKDSSMSINFPTKQSKRVVNEYDNSILYNDMVVKSIIDLAKESHQYVSLVYFSDHGEDVFEHQECACHTENKGTQPMYEIPFIVWLSDQHPARKYMTFQTDRPYMLDNFVNSIGHLARLQFDSYDETKSIFSSKFERIPRIIQSKHDYDEKFPLSIALDSIDSLRATNIN